MNNEIEDPLYNLWRVVSNVICNAPKPCGNKFSISITLKEREIINERFRDSFLSENLVELGGNIWDLYTYE